ncbi:MAG: hypothetical protein EZS28_021844 [Streblomastix strix]|uniref:Uncharacterized protein n=1 Tax=Streblomastix strix TaxID=222440 RepID=A0A5J4VJV8_9EUKA|nr:MAG: hypothetical protein EZS28_021844 [Streblomastix strix]
MKLSDSDSVYSVCPYLQALREKQEAEKQAITSQVQTRNLRSRDTVPEQNKYQEEIRIGFANALRNFDDAQIPDDGQIECRSSQTYQPESEPLPKRGDDDYLESMQHIHPITVQSDVQDVELKHIIAGEYQMVPNSCPKSYIGNYQLIPQKRYCYGPKIALYRIFIELFPFAATSQSNFYNKTQNVIEPRNRTDLCSDCHIGEQIQAYMRSKNLTLDDLDEDKKQFILLLLEIHKKRADHQ